MGQVTMLKAFLNNQNGATAIEYGLLIAGIALAITLVIFSMGDDMYNMYIGMSSEISVASDTAADERGS